MSRTNAIAQFIITISILLFSPILSFSQQESDTNAVVGTGILSLQSTPPGIRVYVDGKIIGRTPIHIDSVTAGPHRVVFFDPLYVTVTMDIDVPADDTLKISVPLRLRLGQLSLITSKSDEVYRYTLNGRTIPPDSMENLIFPLGTQTLKVFDSNDQVVLTDDVYIVAEHHAMFTIHMKRVNYVPMVMNAILPGTGQLESGEILKGCAFLSAIISTGYKLFDADKKYEESVIAYQQASKRYNEGIGPHTALTTVQSLRNGVNASYADMDSKFKKRTTYFFFYLGIVALSELDIVLTYPTLNTISLEVKQPKELLYPGLQEPMLPELGINIQF